MPLNTPFAPLSLLWPAGTDPRTVGRPARLSADVAADLDLERLVNALAAPHGYHTAIREILLYLCDNADVIRYRQDVLDDLLAHPDLARDLAALLPKIQELESYRFSARPGQSSLYEIVWRVGQLEAYVDAVNGLNAVFARHGDVLRAAGLIALRDRTAAIAAEETFAHLAAELPAMVQSVRGIASITVGINLDEQLRPSEVTLLSVNSKKFQGPGASLLGLLFGRSADGTNWEGIAPLHSAALNGPLPHNAPGVKFDNPLMVPLFRDLADVTKKAVRPVAASLGRYVRVSIHFLDDIGAELGFYLGAARLVETLHAAGLPTCRPEIAPLDARVCAVDNAYNVNLALRLLSTGTNGADAVPDLRDDIVLNAITFDDAGRIFVLTGPNQGGKTTYTQAVGLVHVLAGAGLFVPGTRARLSPVDNIYTHFPVEERPDAGVGRLGEEAQRLNTIFARATRYSLVLMNESLSSTSPGESLYLARDVVRALRILGARAIFATHLHDLAADCDALNAETPGDSTIISLVALAMESEHLAEDESRQTFQIVAGPPRGRSYAHEIAARYGISFEQLTDLLNQRGVVDEPD